MGEDSDRPEPETWLKMAGTHGMRNYVIFIFSSFGPFFSAMNILSYQFLGATPSYWCQIDDLESSNFTWEQMRNLSIPYGISTDEDFSSCTRYSIDYSELTGMEFLEARQKLDQLSTINNSTENCYSRSFEPSFDTIVTKWDLVCGRRVIYSSVQAALQGGMLVGSILFGYLIDRFGRLIMYKISVITYIVSGLLTAAAPNVALFIVLKLVSSTFAMGFYMAGMMLAMEHCEAKQRSLIGNYYVLPWAFGMMAVSGIAYLIRPWYYLQIALFVPAVIMIPNFWILLESPRWLIGKGRFDHAYDILEKLARANGRNLPPRSALVLQMKEWKDSMIGSDETKKSLSERMKESVAFLLSPLVEMFTRTVCIFFCWFSVSMVYYGVTLGSTTLSADDYLYMLISGILEIPSYLLLWPATVYLGRKKSLIALFLLCGVSILAVMVLILIDFDNFTLKVTLYLLGKFSITAAFHLLWVFTAELYPTKFRTLAVGEASSCARVGSICSPYINDLLYKKAFYSPSALFGGFSLIAGCVCFALPETRNMNLLEVTESRQQFALSDSSESKINQTGK